MESSPAALCEPELEKDHSKVKSDEQSPLAERMGANVSMQFPLDVSEQLLHEHSKTSFEKNCFSAWASTLNMGLINKVDMVCLSPVGYGV